MFLQTFSPSPVFFEIGYLTIHWYGLFFALSFVVGYFVGLNLWKKSGRQVSDYDKLFFWLIIWGVIGARLLDVFLFEWEYFKNNLGDIYKIWEGGLAIHGGLIFGFIVIFYYCKKNYPSLLGVLDIFAPAVALGQALGRWGNYFNQELFGKPTGLPWGIYIEPLKRPAEYVSSEIFHPVFLYESIGLVLIFWCLWKKLAKNKPSGTVFIYYLLLSSALRFFLEFIRVDQQMMIQGLRSGQMISGFILIFTLFIFYLIKTKNTT